MGRSRFACEPRLNAGRKWGRNVFAARVALGIELFASFYELTVHFHELARLFLDPEFSLYTRRIEVPADTCIIRQGDPAEALYFVRSGQVTVRVEGLLSGRRLRTYGAGTVVEEIAMYIGSPRSASVYSNGSATLIQLDRSSLDRMVKERPALAAAFHGLVAKLMCERLASTTRLLRAVV